MERIPLAEAARVLDTTPTFIKKQMRAGKLPIGLVFRGEKRHSYFIYREWLDQYVKEGGTHENVTGRST